MLKIFERQEDNTGAFILALLAALFYSTFGLISALADDIKIPFLLFTTLSAFFAVIFNYLFNLISIKEGFRSSVKAALHKDLRKIYFQRVFFGTNTYWIIGGFYFISNKIHGIVIQETAPIITIIISYFVLKDKYKNEQSGFYLWFLVTVCFLGVIILYINETTNVKSIDNTLLIGGVIILIGSIFKGFAINLDIKIIEKIQKIKPNVKKFNLVCQSQFFILFCLLIISSIALLSLHSTDEILKAINFHSILLTFSFGLLIEFVGTVLNRLAGIKSSTRGIFAARYLSGVMGIFLLWLFGYGEINTTIILAFILILTPNILLNLDLQYTLPIKITFICILLSTIILFYTRGNPIDTLAYFASTTALLAVFALTAHYLSSRSHRK